MSNKSKKRDTEGNKYDKIFKENINSIFVKLVEWQSDFKIKDYKPLQPKLQTTLERELD